MSSRALAATVALIGLGIVLSGCANAPAPAQPTTTVTITAPASSPSASSAAEGGSYGRPLTAEDAWVACFGATFAQYGTTAKVYPYSATSASGKSTVTAQADGTFEVLVAFAAPSGPGAEAICEASGTVGDPIIELKGGRDFG